MAGYISLGHDQFSFASEHEEVYIFCQTSLEVVGPRDLMAQIS